MNAIDLLNTKFRLIIKLEEFTREMLEVSLDDEEFESPLNKYNDLIDRRQNLMNDIDDIDIKMNDIKSQLANHDSDFAKSKQLLESDIKAILKNIIDMDKKIKLITEKELALSKKKLSEIEQKLKTSDFDLKEEDKKPVGYFLNKKS